MTTDGGRNRFRKEEKICGRRFRRSTLVPEPCVAGWLVRDLVDCTMKSSKILLAGFEWSKS